jgi:RNA polymerase sigma factor (sigma-70 family)
MMTDSDLLRSWAQSHDQNAFTELVRRYGGLVVATALRRCNQRRDLADEVSQRVFAAVARKADKLLSSPSLSAWLHRATVLECAHLARRESIYSKKLATLAQQTHAMNSPSKTTPPDVDVDLLDALDAALLRLRDRDREILMLRHVQGLSYREIASILGKNEGATQRQGSRALETLATRLKSRYAAITGVAVSAQLSHGLSLPSAPVAVESLSALARKLGIATGSTGAAGLWLGNLARGKTLLAGAAVLTVIGVGVYLCLRSSTQSESLQNAASLADVQGKWNTKSSQATAQAVTTEAKPQQPLSDEERERLLAMERVLTSKMLKQLYQVNQALFAYASIHDQQFPNPKERTANAALRELFSAGLMDDEKLFCLVDTKCSVDGNIGSAADDYAKALGPNENSISYVAGLASDRDDSTLPIIRADYVGKSGVHYVIVARIGGNTKVFETTDGIVLDKRNGDECDIFSKAYGTVPENILSPVMTDAVADEEWEEFLNLAVRDPDAARERCLLPQEGKDMPPWLVNAAAIVFGNVSFEQFEVFVGKIQALSNEQQRQLLQRAIGSNFASYYAADRQSWPRMDRLFQTLCKSGEFWYANTQSILDSRLKQESAAEAIVWLEGLPPSANTDLVPALLPKLIAEDPKAAANFYVKMMSAKPSPKPASDHILAEAVTFWQQKAVQGEADWAAASEWLLKQDQTKADQAKGTLAREWLQIGETEAAMQWAESILGQKHRATVLKELEVLRATRKLPPSSE